MEDRVEVLRGLETADYAVISGYFSDFRPAYEEMDEEFKASELLEETDMSERRALQILGILEDQDVVDELEEGYRKNGYGPDSIQEDLDILRDHY